MTVEHLKDARKRKHDAGVRGTLYGVGTQEKTPRSAVGRAIPVAVASEDEATHDYIQLAVSINNLLVEKAPRSEVN